MAENIDAEQNLACSSCGLTMEESRHLAARRSPSASIGEDGLPELPKDEFCAWLLNGRVANAFTHGVGDRAIWDRDQYWSGKGYDRAPLFTADQMRQYARDAIAADRRAREEAHTAEMAQWARDNGLNVPKHWDVTVTNYGNPVDKSAQGVKTWQERMTDGAFRDPASPGLTHTGASAQLAARDAEIADLRTQLARTEQNLQTAVKEAWNRMSAQHRAEELLARQSQNMAPPVTPEEVVAFIGNHYNKMYDSHDVESIVFELTVHDLQSAMRWWFDDFAAPPLSREPQLANLDNRGDDLANSASQVSTPLSSEQQAEKGRSA